MAKEILKKEYAVIRIQDKTSEADQDPVPVNNNGKRIRIRRGEIVPVHENVVSILRQATRPYTSPLKNKDRDVATRRKDVQMVPRFPFEMFGKVDERVFLHLESIAKKRSITEKELEAIMAGEFESEGVAA